MKHKHYECIVAWAGGAKMQMRRSGDWIDCSYPEWDEHCEYRIKPELTVRYAYVNTSDAFNEKRYAGDNLKLTFDGDKLIGAEVL